MIKYSHLILCGLALTCISCARTAGRTPPGNGIKQLVLFQHSFVNYAWGYQNRGWFIDRDGNMKAYRIAEGDMWHKPETAGPDSGYFLPEALESNYNLADRVIFAIPPKDLLDKYNSIAECMDGQYSKYSRSAYDAGAVYFYAYYWDAEKQAYKQVLLSQSGDFSQYNEDPGAFSLDIWLKELNQIYADSLASSQ